MYRVLLSARAAPLVDEPRLGLIRGRMPLAIVLGATCRPSCFESGKSRRLGKVYGRSR